MQQFVIVLGAALAMLFNILGVPQPGGSAATPADQPSWTDVMMVVDGILQMA